jgi:hypothetical protein
MLTLTLSYHPQKAVWYGGVSSFQPMIGSTIVLTDAEAENVVMDPPYSVMRLSFPLANRENQEWDMHLSNPVDAP